MELSRWMVVAIACFVLQACTNMPSDSLVSVEYDRAYDFSHVQTIAIQPVDVDTVATMFLSDEQISRINGALRDELMRRGFEVVMENTDADLFLSWRFLYKDDSITPVDSGEAEWLRGTLYVNMIDPIVLQQKWRASFHADLRYQPETPEAAQYRREVAQAILAQFPPGAGA
ncbi:MAG: DUF4136 domain-containing protein [Halioglobus sp.]|nr:DUF4136 domain-containing protein [Halioglobus sp.]